MHSFETNITCISKVTVNDLTNQIASFQKNVPAIFPP